MAVTLTRNFYINSGLFLFACLALALSIWALLKPCKKSGFGDSVKTFPNKRDIVNLNNSQEIQTSFKKLWYINSPLTKDDPKDWYLEVALNLNPYLKSITINWDYNKTDTYNLNNSQEIQTILKKLEFPSFIRYYMCTNPGTINLLHLTTDIDNILVPYNYISGEYNFKECDIL